MGPCEIPLDLATVGPSLGSARVAKKKRPRENGVEKWNRCVKPVCLGVSWARSQSASLALMWSWIVNHLFLLITVPGINWVGLVGMIKLKDQVTFSREKNIEVRLSDSDVLC